MIKSLYKCTCGKVTEHSHSIKERPETIKCSCGLDSVYSFAETVKGSKPEIYWFNDPHYGAISRRFL